MTTLGAPEDEQFRDHGSLLDPNCPAADVAWPGVNSDGAVPACWMMWRRIAIVEPVSGCTLLLRGELSVEVAEDRKSTRLNSSHVAISYAVFCLKTKKKTEDMKKQETSMKRLIRH